MERKEKLYMIIGAVSLVIGFIGIIAMWLIMDTAGDEMITLAIFSFAAIGISVWSLWSSYKIEKERNMRSTTQYQTNRTVENAIRTYKIKGKLLKQAKKNMSVEEYEKFEKQLQWLEGAAEECRAALISNIGALEANTAALKSVKIDPAIAGGLAQGAAGLGAGVYAAMSAEERNAEIDRARAETMMEKIHTEVQSKMAKENLVKAYNRTLQFIEKDEDLKAMLEKELSDMQQEKDEKKRKAKENKILYWMAIGVVALLVIIFS